ncbi:hypothetical protein CLOSTHATH_03332 [Hungatella hathewayi DSM 13479]|uniref:Uncharacterized protein n=1 Tax=Hungatella hathewayi DSM 13479 TaxID=566550 RepID=D3AI92_9FIRM|nr:hypothetical protein CLOSTHATH_03332 [Hungatella hathewayi DSM 13479]
MLFANFRIVYNYCNCFYFYPFIFRFFKVYFFNILILLSFFFLSTALFPFSCRESINSFFYKSG